MNINLLEIKIIMVKKCLSINDLVEKTKLGRATISRILNGKQKPTTKTLGRIAVALDTTVEELLLSEE